MSKLDFPSPLAWLWDELALRYGSEVSRELHEEVNRQYRAYAKQRRGPARPGPRKGDRTWKARKKGKTYAQ